MPAKAGIQRAVARCRYGPAGAKVSFGSLPLARWIPAFAGMALEAENPELSPGF
jgi:hypothetical protein